MMTTINTYKIVVIAMRMINMGMDRGKEEKILIMNNIIYLIAFTY